MKISKKPNIYSDSLVKITKGKELANGTKIGWPAKGLGRWVWCKYCERNVIPAYFEEEVNYTLINPKIAKKNGELELVREAMIICSGCGAGLKRFTQNQITKIRKINNRS